MDSKIVQVVCSFAVCSLVQSGLTAPLVVEKGGPQTITSDATYESATLNDDLTIATRKTLTLTGPTETLVGTGPGTNATLTLETGATFRYSSSPTLYGLKVGYLGGTGTVSVAADATIDQDRYIGLGCNLSDQKDCLSFGRLLVNGMVKGSTLVFGSNCPRSGAVRDVGEVHLLGGGVLAVSTSRHNDLTHGRIFFEGGELSFGGTVENFFGGASAGASTDLVFEDGMEGVFNTGAHDVGLGASQYASTRLCGSGTLVKRGAGTLDLTSGMIDTGRFLGDMRVEEGKVKIDASRALTAAYAQYRFTVTEGWGSNRVGVEMSELALYSGAENVTGLRSGIVWDGTYGSSPAASPVNECVTNLFDGSLDTKYYDRRGAASRQGEWTKVSVIVLYAQPIRITSYKWATGNSGVGDASYRCGGVNCRDPKSWKLEGSNDGVTWQTLDVRTDVPSPMATKSYTELFDVAWRTPTLIVADGATLELTGTGVFTANLGGSGVLRLADGASLVCSGASEGTTLKVEANGGSITKDGAGSLSVVGDAGFGGLSVKSGTLALQTGGTKDSWWRFSLKQTGNNTNFEMSEMALYSDAGVRQNLGIVLQEKDLAPASLEPGKLTYSSTLVSSAAGKELPEKLFDGTLDTKCYLKEMALVHDDPSTWKTLTFRLPASATEGVRSYNVSTGNDSDALVARMPRAWRLESSADGVNWTIRDERTYGSSEVPTTIKTWFVTDGTLDLQAMSAAGSCPFAPTVPVSVAADALQTKLLEIGKGKSFVFAWSTSSSEWTSDGLKGFREKTGTDPLLYFVELNRSFGTWPEPKTAGSNRAKLAATIRHEWERRRAVPMVTWHIENPYAPPAWTDPKYGRTPMRYRYASKGYPQQHRYLAREIVNGTGERCGEGRVDGTRGPAFANPRSWYLAQLDELASFCAALYDSDGRAIPIVLRLFHECEDDWQWWGVGSATPADYIALFRLSVERLREKNPIGNMLFCYSPDRYWKTLGEPLKDGFLARYPGDAYVEMIGFDDYGFGKGDLSKTTAETVRKMRLVSEFGVTHGKICGLCETGVKDSCDTFYSELHKAMTSVGVSFAFAATYDGPWTFPETAVGKKDMATFFDRAEVVSGKNSEPWLEVPKRDIAADVDPFIGTAWNAHLYPGPKWPNGMVAPSPDTGRYGWTYCGGYQYDDKTVWGCSQTHMSGAGSGEMLDVLLQPFTGDPEHEKMGVPGRIDKRGERASAGYYAVTYTNFAVRTEITASSRVAYYRYTYQRGGRAKVLVDLDWGIPRWYNDKRDLDPANRVKKAESEVIGKNEIRGFNITAARVPEREVFFDIVFSRPFESATPLKARKADEIAKRYVVDFGELKPGESVVVKAAVTGTDLAGARGNVAAEPGFDFDGCRAKCRAAWNERLSHARPEGDDRQRKIYATAFYHASLEPSLFMDADGRFRGTDRKIHQFKDVGHTRYTMFPLWDLMRASLPMYALLMPDQACDFARTMLDEYDEIGRLTNGIIWGREVGNMLGDHSVPFLVDMVLGGILKTDEEKLFTAVDKKLLTRKGMYRSFDYDIVGYFPIDAHGSPCSHTLEYCLDDACAALLARRLGKAEKTALYERRAQFYRNLWDAETRTFRARYEDGRWRTPYDPLTYGAGGSDKSFDYTESCGLNYKWHVMQDPYGLVELLGGRAAFVRDLDRLFMRDAGWSKRRRDGDCTGLIGEYAQGNEPQHHVAYFYQFAGRGDRTAEVINEVCSRYYTDCPNGICGNDDLGQMSAWYVFSAMGFYPFMPCGGDYVFGAPQLPAVTLRLPEGKTFRIEAKGLSRNRKYVRSVTLNGHPLDGFILKRADILRGGTLVFEMTDASGVARLAEKDLPRPEYPRPQFERSDWVNLNGLAWTFAYDQDRVGTKDGLQCSKGFDRRINVPFCPQSMLSFVGNTDFIKGMWYHRRLDVPVAWKGKRVLLNFGAVDWECEVFIDGVHAGQHFGGNSSFSVDVTHFVTPGRSHDLVLRVADDLPQQPRGKQSNKRESYGCLYTRVTGIWQTVWMEAVDACGLAGCRVIPDSPNGTFAFQPTFYGAAERIAIRLLANGACVAEGEFAASDGATHLLKPTVKRLWSPKDPFLYDIVYEVKDAAGRIIDTVRSYAGLRTVKVAGNRVLLNGEPFYFRLVLDQGYYPDGIWTASDDAALKRDIELSMAAGFNGARLHQKVFEERFHYWADKLGYVTWGENASWGASMENDCGARNFLSEWSEIVRRDANHPSIVAWTPLNETRPNKTKAFRRGQTDLYDLTKALDPTRPVNEASGYTHWKTDLWTVHNYDRPPKLKELDQGPDRVWAYARDITNSVAYGGQPYLNDEFGGMMWIPKERTAYAGNTWGYGGGLKSEEDFLRLLKEEVDVQDSIPHLSGWCYTQLTDVEQEQNGIYNYDRTPKFDVRRIRAIFSGLGGSVCRPVKMR